MKKNILLILSLPLISFSSNYSVDISGQSQTYRQEVSSGNAGFIKSNFATNSIITLAENEKIVFKNLIAILPSLTEIDTSFSTDGPRTYSYNGFTMARFWSDNIGDINRTVNFIDGVYNGYKRFHFDFQLENNGSIFDIENSWYGSYIDNNDGGLVERSLDWEMYGPGTVKFSPGISANYLLSNPSYAEVSHLIPSLKVRLTYSVEPVGLDEDDDQSKFSVSLDDDGDRVAVGYKESGSNAVVRVYEYSGGSWEQLGDDVE